MKNLIAWMLLVVLLLTGCGSAAETKAYIPEPAPAESPEASHRWTAPRVEADKRPEVELEEVDSTCFSRVGYDRDKQILAVEFITTGLYYYYDVPEEVYKEFRKADSLGGWYNRNIKGEYQCEKIT